MPKIRADAVVLFTLTVLILLSYLFLTGTFDTPTCNCDNNCRCADKVPGSNTFCCKTGDCHCKHPKIYPADRD